MAGRHSIPEIRQELGQLLRKIVRGHVPAIALKRKRRQRIAAGRAPDREIDAIREERAQHAERFGDLERAVVRQHDAAAPDTHPRGC